MFCTTCNKETKNPRFCSRSCAAKHNNKKSPKRKTNRVCKIQDCGLSVKSYRHRLCEYHHIEHMEGKHKHKTLGEYRSRISVQGRHPSWLNAHVRGFCRSWNKDLLKLPCQNCQYSKHVELCHIRPLTSFPDSALLSEVNSKDNVVQLCRNCHWELDNGFISIEDIKPSGRT